MLSAAFTSNFIVSIVIYTIINIIVTILSIFCFVKYKSPKYKFVFDGLTFTYLSIVFLIMSYCLATYGTQGHFLILVLMILLMSVNIVVLLFVVKNYIRKGAYLKKTSKNNLAFFSFFGAILGIGVSRIFLSKLDQNFTQLVISTILYFIALILNFGTMELLKVYYYKMLHKIVDKK